MRNPYFVNQYKPCPWWERMLKKYIGVPFLTFVAWVLQSIINLIKKYAKDE